MTGLCKVCGGLLFPAFGDGEEVCAGCRENSERALPPAIEPEPGKPWQPVRGRIGGTDLVERCPAHAEPEPCPTCAAYIAAGL